MLKIQEIITRAETLAKKYNTQVVLVYGAAECYHECREETNDIDVVLVEQSWIDTSDWDVLTTGHHGKIFSKEDGFDISTMPEEYLKLIEAGRVGDGVFVPSLESLFKMRSELAGWLDRKKDWAALESISQRIERGEKNVYAGLLAVWP